MTDIKMVFDTNCVLCSGSVKFILKHEKSPNITFVNAWSETGLALANKYGLSEEDLHQTYLVISDNQKFIKSNAVLEILRHLKAPWRWLRVLKILPRPFRDGVYSMIAKNRYQWFGYEKSCLIPSKDTRHRFVDL